MNSFGRLILPIKRALFPVLIGIFLGAPAIAQQMLHKEVACWPAGMVDRFLADDMQLLAWSGVLDRPKGIQAELWVNRTMELDARRWTFLVRVKGSHNVCILELGEGWEQHVHPEYDT